MSQAEQQKWDRIYQQGTQLDFSPSAILLEGLQFIERTGKALDLACGIGGNALCLAQHGLTTTALDISPFALQQLDKEARRRELSITLKCVDLDSYSFPIKSWDVIIVSRFLNRHLFPQLKQAVKADGLLLYQTFVGSHGSKNPSYRLMQNELPQIFSDFHILHYTEDNALHEAMLIARKAS